MDKQKEYVPRITVLPWDFNLVKVVRNWTISLGKMKRLFPDARWQPLSDDEVLLMDKPEYIEFKNILTRKVVKRKVMTAIASKEGGFFSTLTIYFF